MKKRALISVSDKRGVVDFCKGLVALGYEIVSTGGTARTLTEAGIPNIGISEITGFPECLDGRVKTLHPRVHAGLLAMRSNPAHMQQLADLGVDPIDVVAVNLYPFKQTILKEGVTRAEAVENIDIGGPTMLRSAAKNYQDVIVVCDPDDYDAVLEKMRGGSVDIDFRLRLMYKVYQHTASYDTLIATYLRGELGIESPDHVTFAYEKAQDLRYGENPHQSATFYRDVLPVPGSLALATQLNGKELSFNNINDTNGALGLLREFSEPAVVAVKHTNPCGVATGKDIHDAYLRAYAADPTSIFGGIVAANRPIDAATAAEIVKIFLEIVIAPSFTPDALEILKTKKNLRVLELPSINAPLAKGTKDFKKVVGGLLVQDIDTELFDPADVRVVTEVKPDEATMDELLFCYKVVKHAKSNAIAISKNHASMGIGVGQTNRIWATQQAIEHCLTPTEGAVLASDAFFPFSDCVEEAHKAGIKAIVQPGGSLRDQDSIDACNKYGIAMVFVGKRHFKH